MTKSSISPQTTNRIERTLKENPSWSYKRVGIACGVTDYSVGNIARAMVNRGELEPRARHSHTKGSKSGNTTFIVTTTPFVERKPEKATVIQKAEKTKRFRFKDILAERELRVVLGDDPLFG
jgi:hypothetical protein